jgi:hypothetical protein
MTVGASGPRSRSTLVKFSTNNSARREHGDLGAPGRPQPPPSLARKAKKYGPGKPILRASGDLRGSLVFETAGGGGTIGEHPTAGQARMIGQAAYEADLGAAL